MADIIRTTLGPRSMLKMLLDASGGQPLLFYDLYVAPNPSLAQQLKTFAGCLQPFIYL